MSGHPPHKHHHGIMEVSDVVRSETVTTEATTARKYGQA